MIAKHFILIFAFHIYRRNIRYATTAVRLILSSFTILYGMTNWSGSLTFDDKIFGNRRYEQVFWVRSWLLSDADLCIWIYRYTFILYMPLPFAFIL